MTRRLSHCSSSHSPSSYAGSPPDVTVLNSAHPVLPGSPWSRGKTPCSAPPPGQRLQGAPGALPPPPLVPSLLVTTWGSCPLLWASCDIGFLAVPLYCRFTAHLPAHLQPLPTRIPGLLSCKALCQPAFHAPGPSPPPVVSLILCPQQGLPPSLSTLILLDLFSERSQLPKGKVCKLHLCEFQ